MTRIYLSPPEVTAAEEVSVAAGLRSGWVAPAGPEIPEFGREIAARVGRTRAVAVNSGTAALHLVLRAWDIGPGNVHSDRIYDVRGDCQHHHVGRRW